MTTTSTTEMAAIAVDARPDDVQVAADEDPKKKKEEEKKPKASVPEFYQFASGGEKLARPAGSHGRVRP